MTFINLKTKIGFLSTLKRVPDSEEKSAPKAPRVAYTINIKMGLASKYPTRCLKATLGDLNNDSEIPARGGLPQVYLTQADQPIICHKIIRINELLH